MKSKSKRLQKLFIPSKHNKYRPSFFETKNSVLMSLFIFVMFISLMNIQTILSSVAKNSKLAAVLSSTLVQLTNEERSKYTLGSLKENELLTKAAQNKAQDMASKGYFAHTSPEGKKPHNWLQDVGYVYQYAGENLAVNFADSKDVTLAWMNSPTHKANIVKPVYTEIGIGVASGTLAGKETIFVAQIFANPYLVPESPQSLALVKEITSPAYEFFEYLINHNHDVINQILIGILALIILALVLKIAIHIKIQHSKLIVNAMLLIAFISVLLLVNNFIKSKEIPVLDYSSYEYENTKQ